MSKDKRARQPNTQIITLRNVYSGALIDMIDDGYSENDPSRMGQGRRSIVAALRKRGSDGKRVFCLVDEYPTLEIKGGSEQTICEPPFEADGAIWNEDDAKRHEQFRKLLDDAEKKGEVEAKVEKDKAEKKARLK